MLTNGTYVQKKGMVGMHLIGQQPWTDLQLRALPPPPPRSDPRFASIEVPQPIYVDVLPLLSEFSLVSILEHLFKPFMPLRFAPAQCKLGRAIPFRPAPQYAIRPREPAGRDRCGYGT